MRLCPPRHPSIKPDTLAAALGISVATVGRELRLGQAWLRRELSTASV
jgi:hypothetical protein